MPSKETLPFDNEAEGQIDEEVPNDIDFDFLMEAEPSEGGNIDDADLPTSLSPNHWDVDYEQLTEDEIRGLFDETIDMSGEIDDQDQAHEDSEGPDHELLEGLGINLHHIHDGSDSTTSQELTSETDTTRNQSFRNSDCRRATSEYSKIDHSIYFESAAECQLYSK